MNSHENEQEEQLNQPLYRRQSHASRSKFIYSREKVDKLDIRSLDRVWERLEEHVIRNSAAYENNKNLPAFQQNTIDHVVKNDAPALIPHKQQALQQRLATLVALLLVTVLVGSLVLVLQAAHHTNTTTGAHGNSQRTTLPVKGTTSPVKGTTGGKQTVSIIEQNGVSRFTATKLVTSAGGVIIWHNQTGIEQVVLSHSNNQTITIASNRSVVVIFKQAEVCIWHLQSNPEAQIGIVVGNASGQPAGSNLCDFRVSSGPS